MKCSHQIDGDDCVPAVDRKFIDRATCWMPALLTRNVDCAELASAFFIMDSTASGLLMSASL